jgi:hypothetical protein
MIRKVLYHLKRRFGVPATLQRPTTTNNSKTGIATRSYQTVTIRRAIVLPERLERDFVYDLAFIASNKNFTYGGHFDKGQRRVIVDGRDLPTDFVINNSDIFTFDAQDYTVVYSTATVNNSGFLLTIRKVEGG